MKTRIILRVRRLILVIILILVTFSCGKKSTNEIPLSTTLNTIPSVNRIESMQVSAVSNQTSINGSDYYLSRSPKVKTLGTTMIFPGEGLEYATYVFDNNDSAFIPATIQLTLEEAEECWIGVADFTNRTWKWQFSSKSINPKAKLKKIKQIKSTTNRIYITVVSVSKPLKLQKLELAEYKAEYTEFASEEFNEVRLPQIVFNNENKPMILFKKINNSTGGYFGFFDTYIAQSKVIHPSSESDWVVSLIAQWSTYNYIKVGSDGLIFISAEYSNPINDERGNVFYKSIKPNPQGPEDWQKINVSTFWGIEGFHLFKNNKLGYTQSEEGTLQYYKSTVSNIPYEKDWVMIPIDKYVNNGSTLKQNPDGVPYITYMNSLSKFYRIAYTKVSDPIKPEDWQISDVTQFSTLNSSQQFNISTTGLPTITFFDNKNKTISMLQATTSFPKGPSDWKLSSEMYKYDENKNIITLHTSFLPDGSPNLLLWNFKRKNMSKADIEVLSSNTPNPTNNSDWILQNIYKSATESVDSDIQVSPIGKSYVVFVDQYLNDFEYYQSKLVFFDLSPEDEGN